MTRDYDPDLLEMDDDATVIYLHAENCPSYCDYACNGEQGSRDALAIEARWKAGDLTAAERAIADDTRKVLRRAINEALARRPTAPPEPRDATARGTA